MQDCETYVALLYAKLCNNKNHFKGSTTPVLKLQIDTLKANVCKTEGKKDESEAYVLQKEKGTLMKLTQSANQ